MDQYGNPKEIIINLLDADSKVEDLSKNLLALFVEVDYELVDVLVYAVREHFAIIPYKAQRNIKFTLRNLYRHENLGDAKLKMSLLSNFDGTLEQTVYLDGFEKYRLTDQSASDKPSVKLLYEWKEPDPNPQTEFYDGSRYEVTVIERSEVDMEKRMRQAETDLQYVLRDLIEMLKKEAKDSEVENSVKTQELENQLLQLIQATEFKEVTGKQVDSSNAILNSAKDFSKNEGETLRNDTDAIIAKVRELELEIRKSEDAISSEASIQKRLESDITQGAPIKVSPDVKRNADNRKGTKDEVYRMTKEVQAKTLEGTRKAKEDALLGGLEQTKVKIALFDDIITQEDKVMDLKLKAEAAKADVRNCQAQLAAKEFDLQLMENESKMLALKDRDLGMRIRATDEALQAMLGDRKDANDRGQELEDRVKEYESLLIQLEKEVNQLRTEVGDQSGDNSKGLFANLGANNPEILKLQGELSKAEGARDEASKRLEKMEGAWIESVEEVSKEAEKLAADTGDAKYRNDINGLLKDIVASSQRSADLYQNLEITDQQINLYKIVDHTQLGNEFSKDVNDRNGHLINEENAIIEVVNVGVNNVDSKNVQVEEEQGKIPLLQERLEELLRERQEMELLIEELSTRKEQREREDAERERKYQKDLADYNRRIAEIDREVKQVRTELKETTTAVERLTPQISELEYEYETWVTKIHLKEQIKRKRENDHDLDEEYVPIPGDPIDIKIANYKNKKITAVPIKRLEEGEYMFATMRINIKLDGKMNSNYKVTVNKTGKTFDLDEFIRVEGKKEVEKLMSLREDHELVVDESNKTELRKATGSPGRSPGRSPN